MSPFDKVDDHLPPETTPAAGRVDPAAVPNLPAESPPSTVPANPQKPIELEQISARTEPKMPPTPAPLPPDQRVGYAVVGLGHLTLNQILPAFGTSKKARLVALVSGDPEKMARVAEQYGVTPGNCYDYAHYDALRDNPEVQVIYIVLPNGMHAEYTIRGARAGKHILCEKPMANSVAECEAMIAACEEARVKLMIAYRIQYEPLNRQVRAWVQAGKYGKVKNLMAISSQNTANPDHWRFSKTLGGGGPLPDSGLYCLNTIRFVLGTEPTAVMAYQYSNPDDPRFTEVEEQLNWLMRFPDNVLASCSTGFSQHADKSYEVLAETGWIRMDPAFPYKGLRLQTSQAEGADNQITQHQMGSPDQFTTELDHMADCVLRDVAPFTPGAEGLQDQRIMDAIYQSAREGRSIELAPVSGKDVFRGPEPQLS